MSSHVKPPSSDQRRQGATTLMANFRECRRATVTRRADALRRALKITSVKDNVGEFAEETLALAWGHLHLSAERALAIGSAMNLTRTQ